MKNAEEQVDNRLFQDDANDRYEIVKPLLAREKNPTARQGTTPDFASCVILPSSSTEYSIRAPEDEERDRRSRRTCARRKEMLVLFFLAALTGVCMFLNWYSFWYRSPPAHWRDVQGTFNVSIATSGLLVSRASYCDPEVVLNWTCDVCLQYLPDFQLFHIYQNETKNTLGLSGVLPKERLIVVTFRGTTNTENWINNLNFLMRPYVIPKKNRPRMEEDPEEEEEEEECKNCAVHSGFYDAFESIQSELRIDVAYLRMQYPSHKVLITGHSLGGALAQLSALDLLTLSPSLACTSAECFGAEAKTTKEAHRSDQLQASSHATSPLSSLPSREISLTPIDPDRLLLYTFGSPRVGNAPFSQWASHVLNASYRLTHRRDVIPHVPPASLGYQHIPHELYFSNDTDLLEFRHCDDVNRPPPAQGSSEHPPSLFLGVEAHEADGESDKGEDPTCSGGVWSTTFSDHKFYLGMFTGCSTDNKTI